MMSSPTPLSLYIYRYILSQLEKARTQGWHADRCPFESEWMEIEELSQIKCKARRFIATQPHNQPTSERSRSEFCSISMAVVLFQHAHSLYYNLTFTMCHNRSNHRPVCLRRTHRTWGKMVAFVLHSSFQWRDTPFPCLNLGALWRVFQIWSVFVELTYPI